MLSADFSDIMMIVIFITFKALIKNELVRHVSALGSRQSLDWLVLRRQDQKVARCDGGASWGFGWKVKMNKN